MTLVVFGCILYLINKVVLRSLYRSRFRIYCFELDVIVRHLIIIERLRFKRPGSYTDVLYGWIRSSRNVCTDFYVDRIRPMLVRNSPCSLSLRSLIIFFRIIYLLPNRINRLISSSKDSRNGCFVALKIPTQFFQLFRKFYCISWLADDHAYTVITIHNINSGITLCISSAYEIDVQDISEQCRTLASIVCFCQVFCSCFTAILVDKIEVTSGVESPRINCISCLDIIRNCLVIDDLIYFNLLKVFELQFFWINRFVVVICDIPILNPRSIRVALFRSYHVRNLVREVLVLRTLLRYDEHLSAINHFFSSILLDLLKELLFFGHDYGISQDIELLRSFFCSRFYIDCKLSRFVYLCCIIDVL